MGPAQPTDGQLLAGARGGDTGAWDALVARHAGRVWAVARAYRLSRTDAEDASQVTWLRLVTHLDTIREPDRVGAWLATTARNECLRLLRKAGRQVPVAEEEDLEPLDVEPPEPDAGLLRGERDASLWSALARLSERCQRLLRVLMADPEPTYQEVSAALDMPIGSIGPSRARCLAQLRARLGISAGTEGSSW